MSNPEVYISKDNPAFFIQHGAKDVLVPYLQSIHFVEQFKIVLGGSKVQFELMLNANHGDESGKEATFYAKENLDKIFTFLN